MGKLIRVCVAPDSFKDAMDAYNVAISMTKGIQQAGQQFGIEVDIDRCPLSDGGEGMGSVLGEALRAEIQFCEVTGPLGERRKAKWWFLPQQSIAILESAQANGLEWVPYEHRNPMYTTTYGVGELIRAAVQRGARSIWIGVGGSATIDGGKDMAEALGYRFLDHEGNLLPKGVEGLLRLSYVERPPQPVIPPHVNIEVFCDVQTPLLGEKNAIQMFGPQKGAHSEMISFLERGIEQLTRFFPHVSPTAPGTGAAGGLAWGLEAFCQAKRVWGFKRIAEIIHLAERIQRSDLVFTGEGCTDVQSLQGKVCGEVIQMAHNYRKPIVLISGAIRSFDIVRETFPLVVCFSLVEKIELLEDAIRHTQDRLIHRSCDVMKLFLAGVTFT